MKRVSWIAFLMLVVAPASIACGGASSQPLTPDPDPTPTDQDIAALQNAQTNAADTDAGAAPVADAPKSKSRKP
jgi:hypothetical protein